MGYLLPQVVPTLFFYLQPVFIHFYPSVYHGFGHPLFALLPTSYPMILLCLYPRCPRVSKLGPQKPTLDLLSHLILLYSYLLVIFQMVGSFLPLLLRHPRRLKTESCPLGLLPVLECHPHSLLYPRRHPFGHIILSHS